MRTQTIVVVLLILTAPFYVKSQKPIESKKLVGSTDYVLMVEVLHKPADTIEWLGSFKSLWVKTLKDYKGNFRNHADSILLLINLKDTHDLSSLSQLERGNELVVFVTG